MRDHPDNLRAFVNGQLNEAETDIILNHLAECDQCLRIVDQLWAEYPTDLAYKAIPELDPITAKRLEKRLVKQIHRSDLSGRMVWLGTAGLMNTHLTILGPMVEAYLTVLSLLFRTGHTKQRRKTS